MENQVIEIKIHLLNAVIALGLWLSGPLGGCICFKLGLLIYIFVPTATTKISEIEHWERK